MCVCVRALHRPRTFFCLIVFHILPSEDMYSPATSPLPSAQALSRNERYVRTAVMAGRTAVIRSGLRISGTASVQSFQLKDHQRPWSTVVNRGL